LYVPPGYTLGVFNFPALTPDGKRALLNGGQEAIRYNMPNPASILVDTATGQTISTPSLTVKVAQTPTFSPDGQHVAYNDTAAGKGPLAMMDYDGGQNPPLFSNVRTVTTHPTLILAWPSFLPDSQAIVYGESQSWGTGCGDCGGSGTGELRLVETGS